MPRSLLYPLSRYLAKKSKERSAAILIASKDVGAPRLFMSHIRIGNAAYLLCAPLSL
jgi:hypothetical protein